MDALWDTSCITASTSDVEQMVEGVTLQTNLKTAASDKIFYYHRIPIDMMSNTPVLVLIHGYPQTSYMWRNIVKGLPDHVPLFVPDIPGYGRSCPLPGPHDKRSVGKTVLRALRNALGHNDRQSIIIAGHDRGARICHRLAVDAGQDAHYELKGAILMDIVPTLTQWQSFGSAPASVGSFHWPFLANVEIASAMIKSQGGDAFVKTCLERWAGKGGLITFRQGDALSVYANSFKYDSVIKASCDDYRAGAQEDIQLQQEDQNLGRKVDVDVLVMYSTDYLGKRYDLEEVWQEWMGKGRLEVEGFSDGVGHFLVEEAPETVITLITKFWKRYSV